MIPITPISGGLLLLYWLRWLLRKRKDLPLVVPIMFTCLFLPKLNLIEISVQSTAGIRIDDLLALALLIIAVTDRETWKNRIIRRGVVFLLILSVLNLGSLVSGRLQGYSNNILFSILTVIRKFEYFSFALTGIWIVRRLKDPYRTFMDEFTLMSAFHVILAVLQILGKTTYVVSGADGGWFFGGAAVSTFNGYYEYGQFLCFGCVIFMCDYLKRKNILSLVMLPATLGMLLKTGSRTSLVAGALLILWIIWFPVRGKISRPRLILGSWSAIGALAAVTVLAAGMIAWETAGRFATLDLGETVYWKELLLRGDFGGYLANLVRGIEAYGGAEQFGFLEKISDLSAASRLYKWGAALDGFRHSPVLGYGPGLAATIDGNYLKMLGETGLAGTIAWFAYYGYFMRAAAKARRKTALGRPLLLMMVSVLINALLIDMFEASKPMEMIWLLVGAVLYAAYGVSVSGEKILRRDALKDGAGLYSERREESDQTDQRLQEV